MIKPKRLEDAPTIWSDAERDVLRDLAARYPQTWAMLMQKLQVRIALNDTIINVGPDAFTNGIALGFYSGLRCWHDELVSNLKED